MFTSRGLLPWNAPCRNRPCMKAPRLRRICAHSGSSLGSNTTHCVPRNSLSSRKSARRRTGRYFHSEASWSAPRKVRAPHTTRPITGKLRRQFTASGLSWPFSPSVSLVVSSTTPFSTASLRAGAARLRVHFAADFASERRNAEQIEQVRLLERPEAMLRRLQCGQRNFIVDDGRAIAATCSDDRGCGFVFLCF